MLRAIVLSVLITYSFIGQAIPAGLLSATLRQSELVDILKKVTVHGRTLKDPRPLADDILAMERKAGHQLFGQEIRDLAEEEIRSHPWGRPIAFTGSMNVLTPDGYRSIAELRAGDEVYSWDAEHERLTVNRVADVIASARPTGFGLLKGLVWGQTIEVTRDLNAQTAPNYRRLKGLKADLLSVRPDTCRSALELARGRYEPSVGRAHVFTLRLQARPYNFVLEGLVIQN